MAMSGASCMMVEQKRDFDLLIVLDALRQCVGHLRNTSTQDSNIMKHEFEGSPAFTMDSDSESGDIFENCQDSFCVTPTEAQIDAMTACSGSTDAADSLSELALTDKDSDCCKHKSMNPSTVSICSTEKAVSELESVEVVSVEEYLRAFTELTRFFKLTGPVFTFVARDLSKKISVVHGHLQSNQGASYQSLQSMIEYELNNGTATAKGSGTRTMLRLHWALEFIIEFMDKLRFVTGDTKTSKLVYDIYHKTLYNHHPWWTQKLAYLAVHTLPSIKVLIDIMCKQDYEEVKVLLSDIVEVGRPILNYTTALYAKHNLSNIV